MFTGLAGSTIAYKPSMLLFTYCTKPLFADYTCAGDSALQRYTTGRPRDQRTNQSAADAKTSTAQSDNSSIFSGSV